MCNVEDAYSCVEDPHRPSKIVEQEVDQPIPRIDILLNFNRVVRPTGKVLPPRAQALIGRMIYKACGGVGYLGTIVDYDVNRRWFRVEYDDEGSEDLLEPEVRNMLATSAQIEGHLQRLRASLDNHNKEGEGTSTSKPKRKKMGMSTTGGKEKGGEGPYVPLSKRTSKKDDYIYF
ncbi:hypothetical protein K1719_010074 [Acacia pycnantha]|nr:hypothetical protein K1719_010074 [Acacia pycnantha]